MFELQMPYLPYDKKLKKILIQEIKKTKTMQKLIKEAEACPSDDNFRHFYLSKSNSLPLFFEDLTAYKGDTYFVNDHLSELSEEGRQAYTELTYVKSKDEAFKSAVLAISNRPTPYIMQNAPNLKKFGTFPNAGGECPKESDKDYFKFINETIGGK